MRQLPNPFPPSPFLLLVYATVQTTRSSQHTDSVCVLRLTGSCSQHPSSLAQAHAVGIKGTQALSMESKKEYKLAQLKGEIAQLEVKARDAKLILGHMKDALSQKMSPGALADEPRTERALAVKLEHLSTMYRIKSDLARAEFANEGKDGLPDSERLKTEGEIQDDMMYASMLAKRSKEAEQLAMQDRLVASKLIGFHDQYQLLMGEDREKAKLDSATVELKEAKKELAEKQDKILEATKLPDERSSADAVKEAMAIEKLQGKAGR